MTVKTATLPRSFAWRRLHSLFGLWIVLFLIEHLITNSQAALLVGENGEGFIRAVNMIKHLPYLPVIEITLLGVPILFHGVWGVKYALASRQNAYSLSQATPTLTQYRRNHAYSWQRITSWILLIGIVAHVTYMRFYMYPISVDSGQKSDYFVRISLDPGLYTVSDRLGVKLYDQEGIKNAKHRVEAVRLHMKKIEDEVKKMRGQPPPYAYEERKANIFKEYQNWEDERGWLAGLEARPISRGEVIAEAPDFGTATLLIVRDSFKSVFKSILYTIFVLSAVFHAFNGLWTFMITWGLVLKMRSQLQAVNWCVGIMILIGFLGLASIWGTYFINLRY